MMTKNQIHERDQLEMLAIDQLVPEDHLVRKIEATINFSVIYPMVEHLYSGLGRPSIDPVILFKMVFIQYIFGIRSMRQTIKEIETNVAYRWFLGFGFYTEVPHFSTFGKNYARRYHDSDVFEQIFYVILKEIADKGLLSSDHVFVGKKQLNVRLQMRKKKHGMRWTTLRGLKKMSMQATLIFAAMNLKKLASWTWRTS